jgi:hypothetical protein
MGKSLKTPKSFDEMQVDVVVRWLHNPVAFAEEALGAHLWSKQREVLMAVATHKRVVVPSAHAMGKTFIGGVLVPWWLLTRYPSCVVTTAPTHHQVVDLLWKEIRAAWRRLPPELQAQGQCDITRIKMFGPDGKVDPLHSALGFATDKTDSFQGIHGQHLFVIADEAGGVEDDMFGILDSFGAERELYIGNPTNGEGRFIRAAQNEELGYHVIPIDAFDSPNWTGEKLPDFVLKQLMSHETEERWRADYGEDSEWYQSRVRACFPDASADRIIVPRAWFGAAVERGVERAEAIEEELASDRPDIRKAFPEGIHTVVIGVDIADEGADKTAIAYRVNDSLIRLDAHGGVMDTGSNVAAIKAAIEWLRKATGGEPVEVRVDKSSVGKGVHDVLHTDRGPGVKIEGVSFGWGALDKQNYGCWRDEMHFALRDWFREGSSEPDIEVVANGQNTGRLRSQLSTVKWGYDARGKRKIESKESLRERGIPSPDELDAACLAFMPRRRPKYTRKRR